MEQPTQENIRQLRIQLMILKRDVMKAFLKGRAPTTEQRRRALQIQILFHQEQIQQLGSNLENIK